MKQPSKERKQPPRAVVVPAFGAFLRQRREANGWSQRNVSDLLHKRVSDAFISQLEQGKILAPDPVLLLDLARIYNVEFVALVDLLAANRAVPGASAIPQSVPETDMIVRGEEQHFVERFRSLGPNARRDVLNYLHYQEQQKGGADATSASFRRKRRSDAR